MNNLQLSPIILKMGAVQRLNGSGLVDLKFKSAGLRYSLAGKS